MIVMGSIRARPRVIAGPLYSQPSSILKNLIDYLAYPKSLYTLRSNIVKQANEISFVLQESDTRIVSNKFSSFHIISDIREQKGT